ncbi:hypothetical protein NWF32_30860 [Pseudomonas qingdaonensis]|nr:hypothetical protein [Pseudomonas qingdaonensis]
MFDERNEVPMAPADVLRYLWQIDFSSVFRQKMQAFWADSAEAFRSMAKANFLSKVVEACEHADLPEQRKRYRLLARALAGVTDWPPTLEQLQQTHVPDQGCACMPSTSAATSPATCCVPCCPMATRCCTCPARSRPCTCLPTLRSFTGGCCRTPMPQITARA